MSTDLKKMTPIQIVEAVRAWDKEIIKKLVIDGVKVKKIWTEGEVAQMLDVDKSTVNRWINGRK